LIGAGADPNRKDNAGNTPLMHAVRGGYVDCIPLLAAHGADLNATNIEGKTARDLVNGRNARYLFEALDQFRPVAK
jgi:ankyrin repeat protein